MKITQRARDFATKQNALAGTLLQSSPSKLAEGDRSAQPNGGGASAFDAEAGMAKMSDCVREKDGEACLPADIR